MRYERTWTIFKDVVRRDRLYCFDHEATVVHSHNNFQVILANLLAKVYRN